jgi:hypothetical protein
MAKAPRPTAEPRHVLTDQRDRARRSYLVVTLGGRSLELWPSKLGPGDDDISRRQAGTPISGLIPQVFSGDYIVGGDTVLLLWWMARRKNGEPGLSWRQVLAEYPTNSDLEDANPDLDLVVPDDEATDDEATDPEG